MKTPLRTANPTLADLFPAEPGDAVFEPVALLGWVMQLSGTVRLSMMLDAIPAPPRPARSAARPALESPLARLRHVQSHALRPLREPFRGAHALAEAPQVRALLAELPERPRRADVDRLAVAMAGDFHRIVGERITVGRTGVADLRKQLIEWMRSHGPAAAYLEWLDAAIRETTEERARQLFARIPGALMARFADRLWAEVSALHEPDAPPAPAEEAATASADEEAVAASAGEEAAAEPATDGYPASEPEPSLEPEPAPEIDPAARIAARIDAWYAPDGWILDHVRTCRNAVAAVCRHEARTLEGLVAAVQEIAIPVENHQ